MKKLLIVLLCLGLCGCATMGTGNKYGDIYNDAVANGTTKYVIKDGELKTIHSNISEFCESLGYKEVIYADNSQGFFVLRKSINFGKALLIGDPNACLIILKYSKADEGKTRIDLLRGSSIFITNKEVDNDIEKLFKLINDNL